MNRVDLLLSCLSEECGEVVQAVSKAQRFGLKDFPPTERVTNEDLIWKEVHDIIGAFSNLMEELGKDASIDYDLVCEKQEKIDKYLELSKELGRLQEEEWVTTGSS